MGSIPTWGAVGSGGQLAFSAQVGYLPGLSVWSFACSPRVHKGFPPLRTQQKNMQKNRTLSCPSLTKTDGSLHLVPGRYKPPTAPGGSLRKDSPGWEKAENKFTATSGLPACVCVCVSCVASIYARVCSSVSCVPLKT